MDRSEVVRREYTFGDTSLSIYSRKYAEDTTKVSISMQLTVEQIWDSFWNFGDGPSPPPPIKTCQGSEKEVAVGKETGAAAPAPDLLGLDIWPGALALCNYLAMHPSLVGCRRVLELGAGMGLPALLAAKLGCSSALLTDYEPLVLELAAENIRLNGVGDIAATHRLDWEDPQGTLAPGHPHSFHVVLAADVLYISDIVLPFVGMLQTLLHPEGIALVAHQTRRPLVLDPETGVPGLSRRDEPYEAFQAAVRAAGLVPRQLGALDAGGSAGPLYLSALAWEQAYIATLEPVARLRPLKG
ncbi:hypothetical protein ACKKBG_A28230 [Auxenochlorella protothecoides x Auxenochlorella symbiontica]